MQTRDFLLEDFTDPRFQTAFRRYYEDLGLSAKNWDAMFLKMNRDPHGKDYAYLRTTAEGQTVGFIQFTEIELTSWFFKTRLGFIREFWVDRAYRGQGHGAQLLALAEHSFRQAGLFAAILTTDTAEGFYQKHGYRRADGILPDNGETVMVKAFGQSPQ